jgi:ubiquinone/menaquinone biosynthesis C-methylase UbiE
VPSLWHSFGRQLARPTGFAGRLTGSLMRLINRAPNRVALEALQAAPDDDVLELGFGPGEAIATLLARQGRGRIHGIDVSQAMLAQAGRRNRQGIAQNRACLRIGDFARLPYPNASFDRVLAVNVAYFWHDPAAVIGELHRVLRPGGRFALYATDADTMRHWKFADATTHRHVDMASFVALFTQAGFAPELIEARLHRLFGGVTGFTIAAQADQARGTAKS